MKKIVTLSYLAISLFADGDYIPLSKLSDDKKIEYNFMDAKPKEKIKKEEEFHPIKSIENSEIKKEIVQEKTEKIQENNTTLNKDFVKEYKKDNILQNTKNDADTFVNKDFSITANVAYAYLTTEIKDSSINTISETSNEILPEISLTYKNNTIKSDILKSNISDKNVDFKFDTRWYKIAYLYRYLNANIGIAYNKLETKASLMSVNLGHDTEEFPTIELSLKNVDQQLQAEYGVSYGKNNNIDNAYEYYLNLGYRVFNNDSLVLIAGYKNKTIEDDTTKIEYKGPLIGVSSTF